MVNPNTYRNLFNMDGKVALVVGGAGGIGTSISEGLAAFGASVVVASTRREKAEAVAREIQSAGCRAFAQELDALHIPQMRESIKEIADSHGGIDILVNCVGTHIEAPAETYSEADWDRVVDLNLKSAFFLSQAVANVQIPKKSGKHIHVSSVRSQIGLRRGYVAYCSSKGGMNLMIKQLATEWGKYNITVNGIAPTFTRTELVKDYLEDPDFLNPLLARITLGRICEPIDLAALAIYLAAPASDFITGQIVFADGGVTACQ